MKRLVQILLLAALPALGWWMYGWLFPSDETVIRRQLNTMAAEASFGSDEAPLAKITNAAGLARHFSADAEIDVQPWGYQRVQIRGRDEIRQAAIGARNAVATLHLEVGIVKIQVAPDRSEASVTLSLTAVSSRQSEPWTESMELVMRRVDGDWLIASMRNRSFIKP